MLTRKFSFIQQSFAVGKLAGLNGHALQQDAESKKESPATLLEQCLLMAALPEMISKAGKLLICICGSSVENVHFQNQL